MFQKLVVKTIDVIVSPGFSFPSFPPSVYVYTEVQFYQIKNSGLH